MNKNHPDQKVGHAKNARVYKPSTIYLLLGFDEGTLSPKQRKEFLRRVATDPDVRREIARFTRQEEMLREVLRQRHEKGECPNESHPGC